MGVSQQQQRSRACRIVTCTVSVLARPDADDEGALAVVWPQASDVIRYFVKYVMSMADLWLEGRWEGKGTCVFYLDLITDMLHLFVYVVFFIIVFTNYGLPLHLVRGGGGVLGAPGSTRARGRAMALRRRGGVRGKRWLCEGRMSAAVLRAGAGPLLDVPQLPEPRGGLPALPPGAPVGYRRSLRAAA